MNEREWLKKAFERRQTYRREGERLFLSAWSALVGSIQTHLAEYKTVDKSCRLEPWIENGAMTIGGVTMRCFPQNRTIQVSGLGPSMECLPLPLSGPSIEKVVQRILEPLLFPEVTAVVKFV
jgi:hypothetical protein